MFSSTWGTGTCRHGESSRRPSSWSEERLLSAEDFREFTFTNPVRFYTSANPEFFRGTCIEADAARLLAERAR
jgi:hypothetical protein